MDDDASGSSHSLRFRSYEPPKPEATYALLGLITAVFVLELATQLVAPDAVGYIFTIGPDFAYRPWSLITSTVSHANFSHLFFNGLFLYFFGPTAELVLGQKRYFTFFFLTGALSGVGQVALMPYLASFLGFARVAGSALGASGALMGLLGLSVILVPNSKMIVFPLPIPIPLWIGGMAYAALDLLGLFGGSTGIGNLAHLSGLVLGLAYGVQVKQEMARRGLRIFSG